MLVIEYVLLILRHKGNAFFFNTLCVFTKRFGKEVIRNIWNGPLFLKLVPSVYYVFQEDLAFSHLLFSSIFILHGLLTF